MEELLKIVHEILHKHKIRYVIIGGIAVLVWGQPRVTADIDIIITVGSAQFQILIEAFRNSGFSIPKDILSRLSKGLAVKMRHGAYFGRPETCLLCY